MSYLTRRERDATIGFTTAFTAAFLAGFLSYETQSGVVVHDYSAAVGLLMVAFGVYLAYRASRRLAVYVYHRGRSMGAEL